MCIVFWKETVRYHILIGNRDEFLSRPTTSAAWHSSFSSDIRVLSGLDLEAGGTWLGVSLTPHPEGDRLRFATLTNFTEPASTDKKPSRGRLVKDYLVDQDKDIEEYLRELDEGKDQFAGFNLVTAEWEPRRASWRMGYTSNRDKIGSRLIEAQRGKTTAVSNSTLEPEEPGEQLWPKVLSGCAMLDELVGEEDEEEDELIEKAWQLLSTANPAPITHRTHLRYTVLVRPIFMDPFAPLPPTPPPFTAAPEGTPSPRPEDLPEVGTEGDKKEGRDGFWYATRVQSIFLIDKRAKDGRAVFVERDAYEMSREGRPRWSGQERKFELKGWVK